MISKELIAEEYRLIQDEICAALEKLDGTGKFEEELWQRPGGGGGRTRVIQQGSMIEKGGVNFSSVSGTLPETIKKAFKTEESEFFATGVSIVLHPENPFVPIIHMNIRYFETGAIRWFGGGIDVSPHYIIKEDAAFFHREMKKVCDRYHADFYKRFKERADNYFFIKHRNETRGVGGIFYDRLSSESTGLSWAELFDFSKAVGRSFAPVYAELSERQRGRAYTSDHKNWQYLRRGRYAEFNLVYDDGTKFGLETSGRIESILMSLPPQANWQYNFQPPEGGAEAETQRLLRKEIDWISY